MNHRRILNNEVLVYTICQKSFKKQLEFLKDNLENLYVNHPRKIEAEYNYLSQPVQSIYKGWETEISSEPLDWFWREMWVYSMIDKVKPKLKTVVTKAYKKRYRTRQWYMENYSLVYNPQLPIDYMEIFGELNLSNFRWSISKTTKLKVTTILKEGLDKNLTITDMAKQISWLDKKLFSKARAKIIATTEVGKAYEHGNYLPVKQLSDAGVKMKKKRQTVNDSRVRPTHMDNENQWRVALDTVFWATGTELAPEWVNCRCTMLYDIDQ